MVLIIELLLVLLAASTTCYGAECVDPYPSTPDKWGDQARYCADKYEPRFEQLNNTHTLMTWKQVGCSI